MLRVRAAAGIAAAAVVLVLVAGLATRAESRAQRRAPTYFQDVKPILEGRCTGCHMTGGIAPFSLRTYRQARSRRAQIAAAVRARAMPPWHAERGYRRYVGDPSLTRTQIDSIARWAAHGAPRGNPAHPGRPLPPIRSGVSRADTRLALPEYTPRRNASGADDYHCFVARWPEQQRYVTGVDVTPGERREVHHIIVFAASPQDAALVDEWDDREPGAGYRCYGGPSASGARQIPARLLAGWAPGGSGGDFPAGTGTRVEPGSRLIVQIHYNLDSAAPKPDHTVVVLQHEETAAKRGGYVPVVDLGWLISPQTFRIPAGARRVRHSYTGDPRHLLGLLGSDLDLRDGFVIHSALLHMHRLGTSGQVAVVRGSGRRSVLLSIENWDFDWQRDYRLATPVRFANGDRLSVRCTHDNSAAHQPLRNGRRPAPRLVTWGEDSSDEMCIAFVYVSEL